MTETRKRGRCTQPSAGFRHLLLGHAAARPAPPGSLGHKTARRPQKGHQGTTYLPPWGQLGLARLAGPLFPRLWTSGPLRRSPAGRR